MNYIKTYTFTDSDIHNTISTFLINKEQYILNTYPFVADFGTNYGATAVTTRTGTYNVFNMRCTELEDLLVFINSAFIDYTTNVMPSDAYNEGITDPAISAWLHVIKETEAVNTHKHSVEYSTGWSFVAGVYCLSSTNTTTVFNSKTDSLSSNDVNGTLTLFPPHYNYYTINNTPGSSNVFISFDIFFKKSHAQGDKQFYTTLVSLSA
jgi:hypothetical protein